MNTVRSVAAEMDMNEIFRSKDAFETEVQSSLSERMGEYGYEIVNVLVDDPMPSEEVRRSFDRVISSTRLKEAAQNEADAEKVRRVGVAEAQKQALELTGQGLANMRDEIAKGHARAIQDLIRETGLSAIQASDYLAKAFETEAFREAAEHGGRTVYIGAGVGGQTPMSLLVNPSDDGDERPTARQRANAKNDLPPAEPRIS